MAEYPKIVLTNAGLDMIAESQTGRSLIFTKLKLGDGLLGEGESISTLTALKSPKLDIPIQGGVNQGSGQARLRYLIDNSGVPVNNGFFAREVGVYAKLGEAGTEQLYAYANGGNKVDWIPDLNTPMDAQIFDVFVLIGNASNVTVNIDSSATYATILDLQEHSASKSAHADLLHLRKNTHTYAVGDIVRSPNLPSYAYAECTVAGTTAATEPTWPDVGSTVTDGTVTWIVRDMRVADAQFDASTKIATTSFVQRALGNNQGWKTISADTVLSGADAGKVIGISSTTTSDITITLPAASSVPVGAVFKFASNSTAKTITIKTSGSDTITAGYQNGSVTPVTSISMTGLQATAELACATTDGWFLVSGTSQLKASEYFRASLTTNGYQKLPSGLTFQWGNTQNIPIDAAQHNIVFPIAFSSAVLGAGATIQGPDVAAIVICPYLTAFYPGYMTVTVDYEIGQGYAGSGKTTNVLWWAIGI